MPSPKILVLYNQPQSPKDHPAAESEHMVVEIALHFRDAIAKLGYRASLLGLGASPEALWQELQSDRPDAVVNLYEGTLDDAETESYVAGLLAWSGIPFTGCPPQTLSLARAKHLTKFVFKAAGLPTADFLVVNSRPIPQCRLDWPVIVKPATQDASVGIDHASVCRNQTEMEARVGLMLDTYGGPILVEEFIAGRELLVAVTALPEIKVLPAAEILFPTPRPGAWPILTYGAKWKIGSEDYEATPPKYPADVTPELAERLGQIATAAFRLLGCRDYVRVDFRVNKKGEPFLLEVNPNPEISDDSCFGYMLKSGGVEFDDFLRSLVEQTLKRSANRV